jgi:hypothetical protein
MNMTIFAWLNTNRAPRTPHIKLNITHNTTKLFSSHVVSNPNTFLTAWMSTRISQTKNFQNWVSRHDDLPQQLSKLNLSALIYQKMHSSLTCWLVTLLGVILDKIFPLLNTSLLFANLASSIFTFRHIYTTASNIATSLIHSKIDCNSLTLSLHATQINSLQK